MISHSAKPHSSNTTASTDIITYRYNDELVYVPVAPDHAQALSHARDAFPQLKGVRDASLSLSLTAPGHAQKFVGISGPAWPKLIRHMTRYQIIDVQVTHGREGPIPIPDITITYADAEEVGESEPAPPYRGLDPVVDDEKASCPGPRSRTSSTSSLHPKRSWFFQKLHGQ